MRGEEDCAYCTGRHAPDVLFDSRAPQGLHSTHTETPDNNNTPHNVELRCLPCKSQRSNTDRENTYLLAARRTNLHTELKTC